MTKASDTGLRQNRVVMMMSDGELKAIDDWRFKNRVDTRSGAIRELIQIGIDVCADDAFESDNASWAAACVYGLR